MQRSIQLAVKHGLDRLFAAAMLLAVSPILAVIAVVIKLDDPGGPVFFRQERLGKEGQIFRVWKFRSMVVDADRLLNEAGGVEGTNRITRVGRVLRALSLDELPQLLNILCGEMSFVGPRPTLPGHWARYDSRQKGRAQMRPGVTGLAQVNGRNRLPWSQRIEFDLKYVADFSLWLDLRIILRTAVVILFRKDIVLDRNPEQVDDLPPLAVASDDGKDGVEMRSSHANRT